MKDEEKYYLKYRFNEDNNYKLFWKDFWKRV